MLRSLLPKRTRRKFVDRKEDQPEKGLAMVVCSVVSLADRGRMFEGARAPARAPPTPPSVPRRPLPFPAAEGTLPTGQHVPAAPVLPLLTAVCGAVQRRSWST